MLKPVFKICNQIRYNLGCAATEDGKRLEISDLGSNRIAPYIYRKQIKALISCAVTTQLICALIIVYAKRRFSHDVANFIFEKRVSQNQCPCHTELYSPCFSLILKAYITLRIDPFSCKLLDADAVNF